MTINVLNFYIEKDKGSTSNPFKPMPENPTFIILAEVEGKKRELALKLSEGVKPIPIDVKKLRDFNLEGYRNYLIITDFLLGENKERLRQSWRLSKEDYRELFFELYFCLLREYATCGLLKKALLLLLGLCKFCIGRKLKWVEC